MTLTGLVFRCGEGDQLGLDGRDASGEVSRVGGLHQIGEFGGFGIGDDAGADDANVQGPGPVIVPGRFPAQPRCFPRVC